VPRRLNNNGILAVNLLGRSRGYKTSLERISSSFDERALAFPSCDSGNVIALAATGEKIEIPLDELKDQAVELKRKNRTQSAADASAPGTGKVLPGRNPFALTKV